MRNLLIISLFLLKGIECYSQQIIGQWLTIYEKGNTKLEIQYTIDNNGCVTGTPNYFDYKISGQKKSTGPSFVTFKMNYFNCNGILKYEQFSINIGTSSLAKLNIKVVDIDFVFSGKLDSAFYDVHEVNNNERNSGDVINNTLENTDQLTIRIGSQTWSKKNLNVNTFKNGDAIIEVKSDEEWISAGNEGKPAWCYYENDPANGRIYGKLYNWYAVNDSRGLAPVGWHIPGNTEWSGMRDYLGSESEADIKMKSTYGWDLDDGKNSNGTNASGFNALPGGFRTINGFFMKIGFSGRWWIATESSNSTAWFRSLYTYNGGVNTLTTNDKRNGFSVRCIKDN